MLLQHPRTSPFVVAVDPATAMSVPFLDLVVQHHALHDELMGVLEHSLDEAEFIGGSLVQSFETAFASYTHAAHCVGVSSGTDALRFALIAAGVRPGDAVVTVANTFIATTEAISQAGAEPVFVDVTESTCTMDPVCLARFLETECHRGPDGKLLINSTSKPVRAVVPVHLYGQPADMDPIMELAGQYNLLIIEDACQAHGARYLSRAAHQWMPVGSLGDAAAFSFYPGKNLGACGDAGAVTTNSADLAARVRMLREHGQQTKYHHKIEGFTGRLDAIQAGFLSIKLGHLPSWNEARRAVAHQYDAYFQGAEHVRPVAQLPYAEGVYHLYVICVPQRDRMRELLYDAGVNTGVHYPIPLHLQPAYRDLGYLPGSLPVSERLSSTVLSLPMFPQLQSSQLEYVANRVLTLSRDLA